MCAAWISATICWFEKLEARGLRVHLAPETEWINYCGHIQRQMLGRNRLAGQIQPISCGGASKLRLVRDGAASRLVAAAYDRRGVGGSRALLWTPRSRAKRCSPLARRCMNSGTATLTPW